MQSMAERLYRTVGVPDMTKDERFATNAARLAHVEDAERPIRDFIAARDLAECLAVFEAAEVTVAPVYDIDQFVADEHVRGREVVLDMADDEVGAVTMHNIIPRLSATPGVMRLAAPKLGQHTAEILARLGVEEAELKQLREKKVV